MQSIRTRQLRADIRYDGINYSTTKPWRLAIGSTVGDMDIASNITENAIAAVTNTNRLNTLIDAGTALDTISELQAAWGSVDTGLATAITSLTNSATTDRALIRTEFATADTALQSEVDDLEVLQQTHAGLHTAHTASLATKAPSHQAVFSGDVTINSTSIVGESGTHIKFNQTNLQLNTHASGSLTGTAFNRLATGITPVSDQVYDIGSSARRFREVWTKDMDANNYLVDGVQLAKLHVGLPQADNTSDANKPISTAAAAKNTSQDAVVALNTAKISYSTGASSQVAANKADIVTNVAAIALNTAKVTYDGASQVSTNKADIATNVVAIALNTAKVTYDGAAQVSTNKTDIATNVSAISLNTAKVTYDGAAQVSTNKADIATNVSAISLNTAKVTYDGAVQVSTNKADIATNVTAIALNTAKITYDGAVQVSTNKADIATNVVDIASNTAKVTYDGAAQVATNVTDIASNVTSLAFKASLSASQTFTGRQQFGNGSAGVDGRLTLKSDDGGANSLLFLDSKKQSESCQIYFRHAGGNKFTIGINGNSDLHIKNRVTGKDQFVFPIGGGVLMPNLPTSSGATGVIWNDGGTLKIS